MVALSDSMQGIEEGSSKATEKLKGLGKAAKDAFDDLSGFKELETVFDNVTNKIVNMINPIKMLIFYS